MALGTASIQTLSTASIQALYNTVWHLILYTDCTLKVLNATDTSLLCRLLHNTGRLLHNIGRLLHNIGRLLHNTGRFLHYTGKVLQNTGKLLHNTGVLILVTLHRILSTSTLKTVHANNIL